MGPAGFDGKIDIHVHPRHAGAEKRNMKRRGARKAGNGLAEPQREQGATPLEASPATVAKRGIRRFGHRRQ